jgi:tetratricopeptide (TPR) repeat protein
MNHKGLTVLGTNYWRSYALFNAGVRREQEGDLESAEKLYVEALKRDPRNRGARLNLGALLLAGNEHDRQRGIEQVKRAREESNQGPTVEADPIYYASSVRLAATLYNEKKATEAQEVATDLLRRIDEKLAEMDRLPQLGRKMGKLFDALRNIGFLQVAVTASVANRLTQRYLAYLQKQMRNASLEKTLKTMRPSLVIMVAGLRAVNGDQRAIAEMEADSTLDCTVPSSAQQYNLACTYSIAAEMSGDEKYLDRSLSHFAFAQRLQPRHQTVVEADESLRYVRKHRSKRFNEILEQYKPKPRTATAAATAHPMPIAQPVGGIQMGTGGTVTV